MEQKSVLEKLQQAKELGKDRKFTQSIDLIINLQGLDMKKTDDQVDFFVNLKHSRGKKIKVCALVGPELQSEAEKVCDKTIAAPNFGSLSPKEVKKLARDYDFFIAQANIMPQVAKTFGRIFGPRGKMPNPKAGCVVPPKASLQPLYDRLQRTIHVKAKKDPVIHLSVGSQSQADDEVAENILYTYNQVKTHLPQEENNIKNGLIKLTMGKTVML